MGKKRSLSETINDKVEERTLMVGVVGLGYVGLPLSMSFAQHLKVVGFDTAAEKVEMLRQGRSYIDDIAETKNDNFLPTADPSALRECDVIIICVPTPLHEDKRPDLGPIKSAAQIVGKELRKGQLVVLESTTYPGTTEEVLLPILERMSGLKVLADFGLAYSPERIDPGNRKFTVENTPKVVGGLTPEWTDAAAKVYGVAIKEVVPVKDCKTAELVKVYENIFRNVNIALVNEMAIICERMDIDVWEVIDAAKTKPYGFMPFYPGPGVGGHCIPLDPFYLAYRARQFDYIPRFIETSGEVNDYMPIHVVNLARAGLKAAGKCLNGAKVAVLGVSYKPNVSDTRESPALLIIRELMSEGAEVRIYDPLAGSMRIDGTELFTMGSADEVLRWADAVILQADHDDMREEMQRALRGADERLVFVDTRGMKLQDIPSSCSYVCLGRGHNGTTER